MDISVVIPACNEESRIARTILEVREYLYAKDLDFEIIVSDNGSSDGTYKVAEEFRRSDKRIKVMRTVKKGKGVGVREGVLASSGDLVLFTDADLSTPIEELDDLRRAIDGGADIAIASRDLPGSRIIKHQSWAREMLGKILNRIIQVLYVPGIHDTQCGFKLFRRRVAQDLFSRQKVDGFLFDAEILYMARKKGYRVEEVPVIWKHFEGSKVSVLRDLPKVAIDLFRIKLLH